MGERGGGGWADVYRAPGRVCKYSPAFEEKSGLGESAALLSRTSTDTEGRHLPCTRGIPTRRNSASRPTSKERIRETSETEQRNKETAIDKRQREAGNGEEGRWASALVGSSPAANPGPARRGYGTPERSGRLWTGQDTPAPGGWAGPGTE